MYSGDLPHINLTGGTISSSAFFAHGFIFRFYLPCGNRRFFSLVLVGSSFLVPKWYAPTEKFPSGHFCKKKTTGCAGGSKKL